MLREWEQRGRHLAAEQLMGSEEEANPVSNVVLLCRGKYKTH